MADCRVLVIGGYGFFGRRLVQRLARRGGLHVTVAGRSLDAGRALVHEIGEAAAARLDAVALDAQAPSLSSELRRLRADVVVNASGPFQEQDYRIPRACIAAGAHAIDLADSRAYVAGITALHPSALSAGVLVTSGASSVPALSSAAADHLAQGLAAVHEVDIGISPGNRTERGLATVRGILGYCGKPLPRGTPETEVWTRHFPGRTMRSRLCLAGTRVEERLGAARLAMDLVQCEGGLRMQLVRLHFLGIPCPGWLMPRVVAQETGHEGCLHFRVQASLPLLGVVASYRGHLVLPEEAAA